MLTAEEKRELRKIVDSELKTFREKQLKKDLATSIKNDAEVKKVIVSIIRDSIVDLYKALWLRRSIWEKEIGKGK